MITQEELDKLEDLQRQAGAIQGKIEDHIQKALEVICEIYGGKLDWWQFPSHDCDRCDGQMDIGDYTISIYVEAHPNFKEEPLYAGDSLTCNLPTEFLFKSIDEIGKLVSAEKEVNRIAAEKDKAKKKAQRLARQAKKEELKATAKNKLTKEEAKALGIK